MKDKNHGRLEKRLEIIKDIKSELYVGTKEAWDYLEKNKEIYETPEFIANEINKNLDDPSYKATPERILGLSRILDEVHDEIAGVISGSPSPEEYDRIYNECEIHNLPLLNLEETLYLADNEKIVKKFSPFFEKANNEGIIRDSEIKKVVLNELDEEYSNQNFFNENEDRDNYFDLFRFNLIRVDFEKALSKEFGAKLIKNKINSNEIYNLDVDKMIKKVIRDKVEDNFEYSRPILCKWLNDNQIESYEESLDFIERSLNARKRRNQNFLKIKMSDKFTKKFIEEGMDRNRDLIINGNYIKRKLKSDKNFIKRFLGENER